MAAGTGDSAAVTNCMGQGHVVAAMHSAAMGDIGAGAMRATVVADTGAAVVTKATAGADTGGADPTAAAMKAIAAVRMAGDTAAMVDIGNPGI